MWPAALNEFDTPGLKQDTMEKLIARQRYEKKPMIYLHYSVKEAYTENHFPPF